MNHHILAKTATDAVLRKFKAEEWSCQNGIGKGFFRVTTDAAFPSPDAAFFDEQNRFLVSFEFKPPTESKRGILTGVGQSIAYLKDANISYLIAPQHLEDFKLGEYLTDLFANQIYGKLPVGLILYENDNPESVSLASNIDTNLNVSTAVNFRSRTIATNRFWAKHQDMPINLFHLLLHCFYLKKSNTISGDAFRHCWLEYMISPTILTDFQPREIRDCNNELVLTPAGTKPLLMLEKILQRTSSLPIQERIKKIQHEINPECAGDNKFQSYRKNFVSFLKHLKVIDSNGEITDSGFKLYHLGLVNGANSKVFRDYFIKELLTTGHHLDLLLDLDKILRETANSFHQAIAKMEVDYENKGYIKHNPNRVSNRSSTVGFLKYECILWRSLSLITKRSNTYAINWKLITYICGLPEL